MGDIFAEDKYPPVIEYKLPEPDERLVDTLQLAYCLGLLKAPPSSGDSLQQTARIWVKATQNNADERERLNTLATNLVRAYSQDVLKGSEAVAEVVCLTSVLNKNDFRFLLELFINGIAKSTLLDVCSLEGLAKLVQGAGEGYLNAADLVEILKVLNTSLKNTHTQAQDYIYQLMLAVSHVLDAMADCKVEGLDREALHEGLAAYMDALQGSDDPHMVYQAAYAFQALECVPDNEKPWQAARRRTGKVVQGVFGLVTAVKGLDLNGFLEGLGHIQDGLDGAFQAFKAVKDAYEGVTALAESGQGLLASLKEGLSFDRKRSWYTALRGTDRVLRDGQLTKFRILVFEAPCRRSLAFQWGVCQRLGDLAANPAWDTESREDALEFLAEIYRNDAVWGHHTQVKQWILDILMHLKHQSDSAPQTVDSISAETVLQRLKHDGDKTKQALYRDCLQKGRSQHPLKVSTPPFATPSLLDRVQNKPDVEVDLRKLRQRRLKERGDAVYIPPQAKSNLQASDEALFDLTEKVERFLKSDQKVLLLLGDSGSGKSTFNRELECKLWRTYKKLKGRIPLFINLPAIERPEKDLIAKQLRKIGFNEFQIRELKSREFVLICDGYDESQQTHNLYTSNSLNQSGEWKAQMFISCRSEYIGLDYRDRFQPSNSGQQPELAQFQEAVIAPFSKAQVNDYIERYVTTKAPLWGTKQYAEALDQIPSMQGLVKNPFLLTLSLEVLPRLDPGYNLTAAPVTRLALYDEFVALWLERGKRRLGEKDMSRQEKQAFESLSDEGFTQHGSAFLKDLAAAVYEYQGGNPVIEYSHFKDQGTWKMNFFSRDDEKQLLREACPLTRSGNQFRFIHRSLLEYGMARAVFEPLEGKHQNGVSVPKAVVTRRGSVGSTFSFDLEDNVEEDRACDEQGADFNSPLAKKRFVNEPSILQFLAERVHQEPVFKRQLFKFIEESKKEKKWRIAAANAITILVRAGIRFYGADLKDIRIPGADLSYGQFDSAQLQGADLRRVNLRNIWLRQANLANTQMAGVQFGERSYLMEETEALSCSYSPNSRSCAVGISDSNINVYDTTTWTRSHTLRGHSSAVTSVVYSPGGQEIVSGSYDNTVRLWDALTGATGRILSGHTDHVRSVAYSPSGQQIASGSDDKTVRLWNAQTGELDRILDGHASHVCSVAYSPSGQQIASGSDDKTVRLWDAKSGAPGPILSGHSSSVSSVMFSPPSGQQIASGSEDKTVRLWDAQTGALTRIISGHTSHVRSVVYSPSGQQIASGSDDETVRLWDAQTGAPGSILSGHTRTIRSVVYSPNGQEIASGSDDKTVRLWDAQTGPLALNLGSHTRAVSSVAFLPSGLMIASCSYDNTVRLWDAQTGAPGSIFSGHTSGFNSVVYSPSGKQIALGSWDNTVQLWDSQTGTPVHILRGHVSFVNSVVYSPNGQQIASGSSDTTVRLWDAQTGAPGPILEGHTNTVRSVVYAPNGQQIASGSRDKTVRLWDTQTFAVVHILDDHAQDVESVVYSPSGQQIASGSWDKTVRLWDTQTGTAGRILSGHTNVVRSVVYSSNGQQIASGSDDNTVRLWDVYSGECQAIIEGFHGRIRGIAWKTTHDGKSYFATGCDDRSVRMWQVMEEKDHYQVRLLWTTMHDRLAVSKTSIQNVQGLSRIQMQLLKQRGSVGEPIPPAAYSSEPTYQTSHSTSLHPQPEKTSTNQIPSDNSKYATIPKHIVNTTEAPLYALVRRLLPTRYHDHLQFKLVPNLVPASLTNIHDTFRVSNEKNNAGILIEGATISGLGAGLYHYIRNVCQVDMSWAGDRFNDMPATPPSISKPEGIIRASFVPWRYYMNVVTFGYSYAFWGWERWERELDWMLLTGVNMALAMVGQERIFRQMYENLGLTRDELNDFFAGPAFTPWQHMGNIQGSWAFPDDSNLKNEWIDSQWQLQGQIMTRMRDFNITAILPVFNGFVPRRLVAKYPDAKFDNASDWNSLGDNSKVTFIPSTEPLYADLTRQYIELQASMYKQAGLAYKPGKIHYLLDLFNELRPVCMTVECLTGITSGVMKALKDADPNAVWTMQSWFLLLGWGKVETKAFFDGVRQLNEGKDAFVIDLYSDVSPLWNTTEGYFGIDWGWSMLNNFGGGQALYGTLPTLLTEPFKGYRQAAKAMQGIGITMEGINNNDYLYHLILDIPWESVEAIYPSIGENKEKPIGQELNQPRLDGQEHLEAFIKRRYGPTRTSDTVLEAWTTLSQTVWDIRNGQMSQSKSKLDSTPSLDMGQPGFMSPLFWYNQSKVVTAWGQLVESTETEASKQWIARGETEYSVKKVIRGASGKANSGTPPNKDSQQLSSGFRFDIVDVTREVMAAILLPGLHRELVEAYKAKDLIKTQYWGNQLLEVVSDTDRILATHTHFMLGPWIRDARASAKVVNHPSVISSNPNEMKRYRDYLEKNARIQITWWGSRGQASLANYGSKEWAGIVKGFYLPRWQIFVKHLVAAVQNDVELDYDAFKEESLQAENKWQAETSEESHWIYSVEAEEDTDIVAQELWGRWYQTAAYLAEKAEKEKTEKSEQ
ncbi:hypothetical protein BGX27_008059 [Mortierella sp. AM989]|nr:hypothetical protein BGX27_008059 [Mortierella sp. AM989]